MTVSSRTGVRAVRSGITQRVVRVVLAAADGVFEGVAFRARWEDGAYAHALVDRLVDGVLATDDPVYQRGLRFLLSTQKPDGSARPRSRVGLT